MKAAGHALGGAQRTMEYSLEDDRVGSSRVGSGRVGSSRGSSPCMHAGRQADNKHATALAKEGFTRGEWMGAALRREGEQRTTTRSLIDLCGEAERRSRWHGVSAPYFDWSSLARNGCGSSSEELSDCSCSAREGRLDRGVTDSLRAALVNHLSFAPFLSSTRRPACLPAWLIAKERCRASVSGGISAPGAQRSRAEPETKRLAICVAGLPSMLCLAEVVKKL